MRVTRKTLRLPARDPASYVYAISAGAEFIKFGYAYKPTKRLYELQVGSPMELKLLGWIKTPNILAAREVETKLHLAVVRFYERGEWFKQCPKTLAIVQWMTKPLDQFERLIDELADEQKRQIEHTELRSGELQSIGGRLVSRIKVY